MISCFCSLVFHHAQKNPPMIGRMVHAVFAETRTARKFYQDQIFSFALLMSVKGLVGKKSGVLIGRFSWLVVVVPHERGTNLLSLHASFTSSKQELHDDASSATRRREKKISKFMSLVLAKLFTTWRSQDVVAIIML